MIFVPWFDVTNFSQDIAELSFTVAFDIEIIWRFIASFPDWRRFLERRQNHLDLALVVTTTIIQIPGIHNYHVYRWLTLFQLVRFYRVVMFVPRIRPLLVCRISIQGQRRHTLIVMIAPSFWKYERSGQHDIISTSGQPHWWSDFRAIIPR